MTGGLSTDLLVPREWWRVDVVRQATEHLVAAVSPADRRELAMAMSIAAGELMENAVKYGREGSLVGFRLRREAGSVSVAVVNEVAHRAAAQKLRARVEWLEAHPTPIQAFHASIGALGPLGNTPRDVDGAGLGLARILYEARCRIRCVVDPWTRVTMEAWREWPAPEVPNDER